MQIRYNSETGGDVLLPERQKDRKDCRCDPEGRRGKQLLI